MGACKPLKARESPSPHQVSVPKTDQSFPYPDKTIAINTFQKLKTRPGKPERAHVGIEQYFITVDLVRWGNIGTFYIAANCTFCCNSITFSRKRLSVSIRSFTVWQEWITVV